MDYKGIKAAVENIEIPDDVKERIIENAKAEAEENGKRKPAVIWKKSIALAVAAAFLLVMSFPVLGANVEPIYNFMYLVSPEIAQQFQPVMKKDEDNGIRMEVISAYAKGDTVKTYITMQDLEEDRIDETIDLFAGYDINTPYDSMGYCEKVGYDHETKKATFLVTVKSMNGEEIAGDKITFTVDKFRSRKAKFEGEIPEIDLNSISTAPSTQEPKEAASYTFGAEGSQVLVPSDNGYSPTKGVSITAIGYVDGLLHIQVCYEDESKTNNSGEIYFKDENGNKIRSTAGVCFWDDKQKNSYQDFIFDIPKEEIGSLTLCGSFVTCDSLTEGSWKVTFRVEK